MPAAAAGRGRSSSTAAAAAAVGVDLPILLERPPNPFVADEDALVDYLASKEYLESHEFKWIGERLGAAEQYGTGVYQRDSFSYINDKGVEL